MKAVVLHQPYATLVALGVKTIETRPGPPNGPMRPDGVRGLPGLAIEPGERIAIVAGTKRPKEDQRVGEWVCHDYADEQWGIVQPDHPRFPRRRRVLSLGAVVCTVAVVDAVPILTDRSDYSTGRRGDYIGVGLGGLGRMILGLYDDNGLAYSSTNQTDHLHPWTAADGYDGSEKRIAQLPYGDFAPGRWGWLLTDVEPCAPVPVKGKQGVLLLPEDVAEQVSP